MLSWGKKKLASSKQASINASTITIFTTYLTKDISLLLLHIHTYDSHEHPRCDACMNELQDMKWMDMAIQVSRLMIIKICLTDNTFVCNGMTRGGKLVFSFFEAVFNLIARNGILLILYLVHASRA
jgi:hypothetical protein